MAYPADNNYQSLRDQNRIPVATGQSNTDSSQSLPFKVDSVTGRLLVDMTGGGGVTVISVTGTINDSNVTFTATSTPSLVNVNGAFYKSTGGTYTWTYVSTTLTLNIPVGTGGTIFAIA